MRVLISILLIAAATFLLQHFGPWWLGALIAFIAAIAMRLKPLAGLGAGFFGLFLAWGIAAGWIDFQNHSILSARIGALFGGLPAVGVVMLTGLIGGLAGALSGLTGSFVAQWRDQNQSKAATE